MEDIDSLIDEIYQEFVGLPSAHPIVRTSTTGDAFSLLVFKALYEKDLQFPVVKENIDKLVDYIPAPPDSGIDIFVEHEQGDEVSFDVVQVKNKELAPAEIRECITMMQRTIRDYCQDPKKVKSESCRNILSNSDLDKENKKYCTYYVVHRGDAREYENRREKSEKVVTATDLSILLSNKADSVEHDSLEISGYMKYYNQNDEEKQAIVCNVSGYSLAKLYQKYQSTKVGRNILFGGNFRESLGNNRSKTAEGMSLTVDNAPTDFWYFNNGITIIADDYSVLDDGNRVDLNEFTIVNGAQTTSTLGGILGMAEMNHDESEIEALKQVRVLARVLRIANPEMGEQIAINTNTQNPITTRDMVSNRHEQKELNEWLLDGEYPRIYVEIRRGAQPPSDFSTVCKHRKIKNDELAQIAFAYFLEDPFTAKDKKSQLFNLDFTQDDSESNSIYNQVFRHDKAQPDTYGELFLHSKAEIDEALFAQYLYKAARRYLKKNLESRRTESEMKEKEESKESLKATYRKQTEQYSTYLDTIGVCMYYFLSFYARIRTVFGSETKQLSYNYEKFYEDKEYQKRIVAAAASFFLQRTCRLLVETAASANKAANMNNWVRGKQCAPAFLEALNDMVVSDVLNVSNEYRNYVFTVMNQDGGHYHDK